MLRACVCGVSISSRTHAGGGQPSGDPLVTRGSWVLCPWSPLLDLPDFRAVESFPPKKKQSPMREDSLAPGNLGTASRAQVQRRGRRRLTSYWLKDK